ncbi:hypothetical protein HOE22_09730 [Candidatus Woesearchaeota archaeon]|jgi:hypothetical protein|nr:hypothetical protein [Candidatus Woesearchaeota archaeon]
MANDNSIQFHLGTVRRVYTDNKRGGVGEIYSTNMIKVKGLNSTLPSVSKELPARPFFRGVHDSITKGDLVLFCILPHKKVYYIGPLNTFNNPNYSPNPSYSKEKQYRGLDHNVSLDEKGYSELFPKITTKPLSKTYSTNLDLDFITENRGVLTNTTAVEFAKFTDLVLEGRHGNSIRIGSRAVNPILNIHNNRLSNNTEQLGQGSLISMMSAGSIEQNFLSNGFQLSVDANRTKEDIFKINNGNDTINAENSYDYNYSKVNPDNSDDDRVDFDQMIIFSDKITFDARSPNAGDFTVSANRNINFGATKNFTLNNKGFSVINSGNIYIGKEAKNKAQPMVLGDELRILLLDIMNILQNSRALVQGVPIPLVNQQSGPMFPDIDKIIKSLSLEEPEPRELDDNGVYKNANTKFLSQYHYVEQNVRPKPT